MTQPAKKLQITSSNVFSTVLGGDLGELVWTEMARQKPWQLFEKETEEELTDEQRRRIPEDIGDRFGYKLETPYFVAYFSQGYIPTHTITAHQYLSFRFGRASQSLAQMLDANPFSPSKAQFKMEIGKYSDSENHYIHLKQNKIDVMARRSGFPSEGEGNGDMFTSQGNAMMQDLLAQKDKMCSVPGLNDTDRELLRATLGILEEQYKAKDISLIAWFD